MNADGGSQTRLTNNAAMDFYPVWFPDHSRVVFASTRDGAGVGVIPWSPMAAAPPRTAEPDNGTITVFIDTGHLES